MRLSKFRVSYFVMQEDIYVLTDIGSIEWTWINFLSLPMKNSPGILMSINYLFSTTLAPQTLAVFQAVAVPIPVAIVIALSSKRVLIATQQTIYMNI